MKERGPGGEGGSIASRTIDDSTPTPKNLLKVFERIRNKDGSINHSTRTGIFHGILRHAEEKDLDVVIVPNGKNTTAIMGKWIADHKEFIEIGAGVVLTTAILAGTGFIIRKHHRGDFSK